MAKRKETLIECNNNACKHNKEGNCTADSIKILHSNRVYNCGNAE